jgi:glutaredoxin-like protein
MNRLLNEETSTQIKEMLDEMKMPLTLVYFTKENCENCDLTARLLDEIKSLSDKIILEKYDFAKDSEIVKRYNIIGAPSYVILNHDGLKTGSTFYGVPAGHEINTLLSNLLDVSEAQALYDDALTTKIKAIDKPVNLKVFVTVSCPHCPGAAINASRLAQLNPNITAEVYESQSFYELANKYQVSGVPKIVINETQTLMGNQPVDAFLTAIDKL